MTLKLNLARRLLKFNKQTTTNSRGGGLNNIYEMLKIRKFKRQAPAILTRLSLRHLNYTQTTIADVPCKIFEPNPKSNFFKRTPKNDLTVLYIHGGGFVVGFPEQAVHLLKALSLRINSKAIAIDYSLSPEALFPTAINQIVKVYKHLIKTTNPKNIIVLGESAGGNLACALIQKIIKQKIKKPAALVLSAPYLDLSHSGKSIRYNMDSDVCLTGFDFNNFAQAYVHGKKSKITKAELQNPLLSPLFGDVKNFPPTYISVTTDEMLYCDSTRMFKKLKAANVVCELSEFTEVFHGHLIAGDLLNESKQDVNKLTQFLKTNLNINCFIPK